MQLPQAEPSTFQKVKAAVTEIAWVLGTSAFVLGFPIYAAIKL